MYTILIIVAIVGAIAYFTMNKKKNNESEAVDMSIKIEPMTRDIPTEAPTVEVEKKVEVATETFEQMEARLKSMTNQDADKPFAKISTPEIDEIPVTAEVVEEPKVEPKKKSAVRKKSPVVLEGTDQSSKPEAADKPKKKRTYKKRAPKETKVEKDSK